ncbi:MAG TPA: GlsB/YeaQ/YmgE family stress response membrane protein [Dissulfurispiraceae bacterium]|nr:GlsB/YeaQ/YmgE family stress response membrane protein [Dissulfurispiraceae bacterium]
MNIFWFLIIGAVAGWLAGKLTRGRGFGLLGDLIVGILGAFTGKFLFGLLGIAAFGRIGTLVTATAGAVLLALLIHRLRR